MPPTLGLYLSIPFCRAKCTFCNFASDAFGASQLPPYLEALEREIGHAQERAAELEAVADGAVDTIYLGGGTPSLLSPTQIRQVFAALRVNFHIAYDAEITIECAPGQLSDASLDAFLREGVNRLSFGVQSFVAEELRLAGRSHSPQTCLDDLARARAGGVERLSVDLIAGLPLQTEASWRQSLEAVCASGVGHVSTYMLEVDSGSRLGREVLAEGIRYGAPHVPSDDECVSFYDMACEVFETAGLAQYEISNFARPERASRHNLKYWRRLPYLGFGLDAHSMLPLRSGEAVRFCNGSDLPTYITPQHSRSARALPILAETTGPSSVAGQAERVSREEALEECIFLGLRLSEGLDLHRLAETFGPGPVSSLQTAIQEAQLCGLLWIDASNHHQTVGLTGRGRALSNEVFASLLEALDAGATKQSPAAEPAVA